MPPRSPRIRDTDEPTIPLAISPEKVCFIIVKARQFDAKEEVTEPDPGSNPSDDNDISVLQDHSDDPVQQELTGFIDALNRDEQVDLVALAWLGRGETTTSDWSSIRKDAAAAHNRATSRYLLGMPLLADFLEEGLSIMGRSCEEFEIDRL
jgi:Protein of unknown function (DUF3775)